MPAMLASVVAHRDEASLAGLPLTSCCSPPNRPQTGGTPGLEEQMEFQLGNVIRCPGLIIWYSPGDEDPLSVHLDLPLLIQEDGQFSKLVWSNPAYSGSTERSPIYRPEHQDHEIHPSTPASEKSLGVQKPGF